MMARKLRKGQEYDADGKLKKGDAYAPIIERTLGKYDAAISLLESYPQLAAQFGDDGKGVEDILELIERKAAEQEADEMYSEAAKKVRKMEPGAVHNQLIRKATAGGLVKNGALDRDALWA